MPIDRVCCCVCFVLQALAWVYDKDLVQALFAGAAGENTDTLSVNMHLQCRQQHSMNSSVHLHQQGAPNLHALTTYKGVLVTVMLLCWPIQQHAMEHWHTCVWDKVFSPRVAVCVLQSALVTVRVATPA
jgi:hypothetical protein